MQFGWELSAKKDNSDTLFKDREPQKTLPLPVAHTYIAHIQKYPGPAPAPPARDKC